MRRNACGVGLRGEETSKTSPRPAPSVRTVACLGSVDVKSTGPFRPTATHNRQIMMLAATDSKHAPWHIVHSDDKRRARLNCISHILKAIPFEKVRKPKVKLPKRSNKGKYDDRATLKGRHFVAEKY